MAFCRQAGARRGRFGAALPPLLMAIVFVAGCATPWAAKAESGSSSDAALKSARKGIPWADLSPRDRRLTQYLVRNHSVFRRMPTQVIRCEPEVFTFLAQRPEVVTSVWNLMGVSKLEVARTGADRFRAIDHAGTQGAMRVLHADWGPDAQNRVLLYAEGVYEAPPLPRPIKARCVLMLSSAGKLGDDGESYVTARLDSFVHFERATADLVARTLQPLLNRTADHNFTETMKFVSTFSQTTEQNPAGIARLAGRLDNVDEQVRGELVTLCHETATRERQAAKSDPLAGKRR